MLAASGLLHAEGRLAVHDAWIRAMPPGASMAAGYATLSNEGDAPLTVLTAQSDAFRSVSVHETVVNGDVSRMREVHRLVIEPGETLRFEPGGHHLMLMSPRREIVAGDKVGITFLLRDGKRVETVFDVTAAGAAGE